MPGRRIRNAYRVDSHIIGQGHEAEVHMQLLMAMEQGQAGMVSGKVHFDFLMAADHDDVLHYTRSSHSGELSRFKAVAVKVDGANIIAGVAHLSPTFEHS
jgi:hypothetical protein